MERMFLRSQVSDEEKLKRKLLEEEIRNKKLQVDQRPFIAYKGQIKYTTTFIDCAIYCDNILKTVNGVSDLLILGFNLEWPFSFQTGSGRTAVIQISPTLDECFIFHVSTLKNLPKSLTDLLVHDKVRLTGVNIKNDVRKLSRDFPGFDTEKAIQNCVDSSTLANGVLSTKQRWSMAKLVEKFFDLRINKDKKVRNSKWHVIPLSEEQKVYAAIDAYASLKLFNHLKQMEAELEEKEDNSNIANVL